MGRGSFPSLAFLSAGCALSFVTWLAFEFACFLCDSTVSVVSSRRLLAGDSVYCFCLAFQITSSFFLLSFLFFL